MTGPAHPPPHAFDDHPVLSEADLLARAGSLVEEGLRRQLWFFLLDGDGRQLPVLIPMDIPRVPRERTSAAVRRFIDTLIDATGAASVAVVYERPGPARLNSFDLKWVEYLHQVQEFSSAWTLPLVLVHSQGPAALSPRLRPGRAGDRMRDASRMAPRIGP